MPTTRISTLSSDGSTGTNRYATFDAWVASLPASLVAADTVEVLEVEHKAGGHTLSVGTSFASKTTDSTRYIEIRPTSGQGHSGVADTAKAYLTGTVSASNTGLLNLDSHTVRLIGMQVFVVSSGGNTVYAVAPAAPSGGTSLVDRCIINCLGGSGTNRAIWASTNSSAKSVITNTVFHEHQYSSNNDFQGYQAVYHNGGDLILYNNTFARCGCALETSNPAGKTITAKNNLVHGAGAQVSRTTAPTILTGNNNAFSMSTAWGDTSPRTSQAFTFKAAGSYKLASGDAGALGFGADLSADGTWPVGNDGGNQARSGTWAIGADQLDAAGSITITGPVANVIGRGGLMTVVGTSTAVAGGLQRRVVLAGTSTVVSGFDWAAAGGSFVTDGAFSFTITGVPNGGWYDCQVRFVADTAITATSPRWAQGRWIMNAGQSNGLYQLSGSAFGGVVSNDKLRAFGNSVTAHAAITPPGGNETGNAVIAVDGIPLLIIQAAVGGTSLASWQSGQTYYNGMMAQLTALAAYGSGLDALLWDQGEAEVQTGTSYATHKAGLESFIASVRSALSLPNLPFIVGSLSTITTPTVTDANWNTVVRALKDVGTQNANCFFADRTDLTGSDGIHLAGAGQLAYGKRRGRALLVALSLATGYRGPRIRKIDRIDATTYDLQLTHVLGTDITPSSGITGISVEDPSAGNAALTVSSAARTAASTIRVILAAGPAVGGTQPLFSILRGPSAGIGTPAKDNSANTLPVEYAYQQPSRTKATGVTVALENGAGAAAANASGLKWAFFVEPTPDLFNAPIAKGGSESISAGSIAVDLSAADMDAGTNGYLIVTDSDGTTTQNPQAKRFAGVVQVA